ncbi:MAG TPA: di-trans,poly-cis-decaprenylcistransferase [Treponema sp.]|nr:di-trans,poly-cis-decaprenylcistransferase [Treponema sp.]
MTKIPEHIGIIMDGNGRWAKKRGLPRTQGHREGLEAAKKVVRRASELGVKYVTLYTFSTENWKRTTEEVGFLMSLIKKHLRNELAFYAENGIRVRHIGDISALPTDIASEITDIALETAHYSKTSVVLAINYGGRDEILRAIRTIPAEELSTLNEERFEAYLDIPELPPVDLLIRTGGEQRISNFLLWQSAYAELYLDDILWPDWNGDYLDKAIAAYQLRKRRFGGIT